MTTKQTILLRVLLLTVFGLLGFIIGLNYGCSYLVLIPRDENILPSQADEISSVDISIERAKFQRNERVFTLRKCCKEYGFDEFPEERSAQLLRNVIVDRKNRFLYCYVPKAASSNMRRLVLALQGRVENPDAIEEFDRRGFEFLGDFNASQRNEMIKTYFKFLFVRHPLERLVSAYRHRVVGKRTDLHRRYGIYIVKKYRGLNSSEPVKGDDVTFREFIKYLLDTKTDNMNGHWKPIFNICHPCLIPYEFIGSVQNVDIDASALLEKINSSRKVSFPKRQEYYNPLTKQEALFYYRNVTYREMQQLRWLYRKDFQCFLFGREHQIQTLPK
ncbi:carbohydrate sulfotransferase 14-like [Dendronephthya gigantea]|uniref:carbohydrate sulfotransferase 14-like n=1 Tax=Dendronephthya gigantea TaxID=151771 RepID=UPI00106C88B1|nr:carbohydrate sulfotransferase 14-like [Dendronephthya gigantea]